MNFTDPPALLPGNWFQQMPAELAEQLQALGQRRSLKTGAYLYRSGETCEGFYRVDRGRLRLSAVFALRDYTIAHLGPGDWMGEVPLLDGLPHGSDAQAVSDSDILMIPRHRFDALLEREPVLYRHFARRLAMAMRLSIAYYGDLAALSLPARLAKRVLELAAQHGERDGERVRIGLRLPKQLLADMMATSRQSVSKELNAWEKQGWITMKYNTVILCQPDALKALIQTAVASPDPAREPLE